MENKKTYIVPQIELIELDNEISLQLESEPPTFENENISSNFEYFINDPFIVRNV